MSRFAHNKGYYEAVEKALQKDTIDAKLSKNRYGERDVLRENLIRDIRRIKRHVLR